MSKQIKARPMNRKTDLRSSTLRSSTLRSSARDVVLAGIGAASLLRKNAGKSLADVAGVIERLPEASSILIEGIGERSTAMIEELGARGNAFRWEFARLVRVAGKEASARTTNLVAEVESRVQPLLRKFNDVSVGFGIVVAKPKPKRAATKATRKTVKPAAKRTARKARKAA